MRRARVTVLALLAVLTAALEIVILLRTPSHARSADWVEARAREYSLQAGEVKHERVAWAADFDEALVRARREHRLVAILLTRGDLCSGRI